jgi:ABC-2 type transport system ATP-binding protein
VASVRQIRNIIKKLNDKGTTVFLTTHYIEEAERLCNRIVFINKGEIIKIDTIDNLLIETNDVNIIEVVIDAATHDKTVLLEKLNQKFPDIECRLKNNNTIKILSYNTIDIAPIVNFLSSEEIFIIEARLLRPSLEDAFVKLTGIEVDLMNKDKEKK